MAATRNVLIPVDGSESAQKAFDFYLTNLMGANDNVLILHVHQHPHLSTFNIHGKTYVTFSRKTELHKTLTSTEPMQLPVGEWSKALTKSIEESNKLIAHFEILCEEKKLKKKTILENGKPGEAICRAAKKEGAHMVVMGSRGLNSLRRTFMGSVSDYVLHHTEIPVTIVPK